MGDYKEKMLRLEDVMERTTLTRSHLYALAASGDFPAPVKLDKRRSAWPESEVDAWIESKISASRSF